MSADRASGAFFILFGLAMYFLAIPQGVENNPEGNLNPNALPNLLSWGIILCGSLLILRPSKHQPQDAHYFIRASFFVCIMTAALYAMSFFGFMVVAPFFALLIMLMIGERRPLWLGLGVFGVPALIWILVVQLLDRSLP